MIILKIHTIVSYDQNIPLIFLWERWIPSQALTSVLCLHYRPETVHCSTKDVYTSEITFFAIPPCSYLCKIKTREATRSKSLTSNLTCPSVSTMQCNPSWFKPSIFWDSFCPPSLYSCFVFIAPPLPSTTPVDCNKIF